MEKLRIDMIKVYAKNSEIVPDTECVMEQLGLFDYMVGTSWRVWRRWPNCDVCASPPALHGVVRGAYDIAGTEWECSKCGANWIQHRIAGKVL